MSRLRRCGGSFPVGQARPGQLGAAGLVLTLVVALSLAAPAATASPGDPMPVPPGFDLEERTEVAPGVEHLRLVRSDPPLVLNVARILPGAGASLRAVVSNERVGGAAPRFERTSAMCRRAGCVVGVNGDFASLATGQPVGGMVVGGVMVRSPNALHHQLTIAPDGNLAAGGWTAQGRVVSSDLRELRLGGVNIDRVADSLVLYTAHWGRSTATNAHGAELVLRHVQQAPHLRIDHTALLEMVAFHAGGNVAVPRDGAVLSGHGAQAAALRDLWQRVQDGRVGRRLLLRVEGATPASESVGGTPVLVHQGKRWVKADGSGFVSGRHPRTLVGWRPGGATLLVTADGRQPGYSEGLSLPEAADLLLALGATEGLNLDGGGSTTFVRHGAVVNTPSDRLVRRARGTAVVHAARPGDAVVGVVERPTVNALVVVPSVAVPGAPPDALGGDPGLPQALAVPMASVADAGSDPSAGQPALVALAPATHVPATLVALALLLDLGVATAWVRTRRIETARR